MTETLPNQVDPVQTDSTQNTSKDAKSHKSINVKPLDVEETINGSFDDCSLSTISCSPRRTRKESDSPDEVKEEPKQEK